MDGYMKNGYIIQRYSAERLRDRKRVVGFVVPVSFQYDEKENTVVNPFFKFITLFPYWGNMVLFADGAGTYKPYEELIDWETLEPFDEGEEIP